jgi:hypothetical protein
MATQAASSVLFLLTALIGCASAANFTIKNNCLVGPLLCIPHEDNKKTS